MFAETSWSKVLYKDSKYFYYAGTYVRRYTVPNPKDMIPYAGTKYSLIFFISKRTANELQYLPCFYPVLFYFIKKILDIEKSLINCLVFIVQMECVYSAVRTGSLNIILFNFEPYNAEGQFAIIIIIIIIIITTIIVIIIIIVKRIMYRDKLRRILCDLSQLCKTHIFIKPS